MDNFTKYFFIISSPLLPVSRAFAFYSDAPGPLFGNFGEALRALFFAVTAGIIVGGCMLIMFVFKYSSFKEYIYNFSTEKRILLKFIFWALALVISFGLYMAAYITILKIF